MWRIGHQQIPFTEKLRFIAGMQNSTTADSQNQQGFPINQSFMMPAGMPFLQNSQQTFQGQNSFLMNNSYPIQNNQQFQAVSPMINQGMLQTQGGEGSLLQDSLSITGSQQYLNMGMQQQFRQDTDWRSMLSSSDRNHVIHQFGAAVQNALPPPHQSQMKVENLARGLEQHIYETAMSRQNYMDKIRDQLQNIERKANEVRANSNAGASDEGNNSNSATQLNQNSSLHQPPSATLASENSQQMGNSLGIDMGNTGPSEQASEVAGAQHKLTANDNQSPAKNNVFSSLEESETVENQLLDSGTEDHVPAEDAYGETKVGGMKVTLLNLKDSEKEAVQTKLEQLKPAYHQIDNLIATLLHHGGNVEFEKVRKLTGMKQMIGIQLDVINQSIYFIRPETLDQLLPSLNQYFSYAERLVASSRNQPSGRVNTQQLGAQRMNMNGSPMLHPNVINAQSQQSQQYNRVGTASPLMPQTSVGGSPNIRPNMMMNPSLSGMSPHPRPVSLPQQMQNQPQYIQQQMNIVQSKIIHIQQQLQQLHQMSLGPIPPEQMMNLQMRQQELLKSQQLLSQQLNSFNQMQQQSLLQVQRGQAMRPPGSIMDPNYLAQIQMMQQSPQLQQNNRLMNPQTMAQRQSPHMQGNQLYQHSIRPPQNQQQQMQHQIRNQAQNGIPDFHGSPKLEVGNMQPSSAAQPENHNSKSEPQSPTGATPRMKPNQLGAQLASSNPEFNSPVQQPGQLNQSVQGLNQQRQGQQNLSSIMPMGMQQNQMNNSQDLQQAQAMMLQGIGIRPPPSGQMNVTPEQMQHLMQFASHQQQMGMPAHMIRHRMNGSLQAQHMQNMNMQNMRQQQQQQFSPPNFSQLPQKVNAQTGAADFQQQQIHQQQQQFAEQRNQFGLSETAEQFGDPFNIGAEPLSAEVKEEEKEEMPMEEFFNFDSFDNPNTVEEEDDFKFEKPAESRITSPAKDLPVDDSPKRKRNREDEDEAPIEKKKKIVDLTEELGILAREHPFTFNLKDTLNEGVKISCTVNSVSFTLNIQNRKEYETSASTITFQTTQKPDSLSSLVNDHLSPGSKSRISDIVKILVDHLKDP